MSSSLCRLSLVLLLALARTEGAINPQARTTSSSKQFIIYCENFGLRSRVAGFVEEVKQTVLSQLEQKDMWRIPIVISLQAAAADSLEQTPVTLQVAATPEGPTIQLAVRVGSDAGAVNLQKHVVRAILLELMYRDRPPEAGQSYVEPPGWLVAGLIEKMKQLRSGIESDLFRKLLQTARLPEVSKFITTGSPEIEGAAAAFDAACSFALLQLLIDQPEGKLRLVQFLRDWPSRYLDPIAALIQAFPTTGPDEVALQKWWTVNVARFGASDRYRGLSTEDTDQELDKLLSFEVAVGKGGTKKRFQVGQFAEFGRLKDGRAVARVQQKAVVALTMRANALLRPVLSDYEQVFALIAAGRLGSVGKRIHEAETYRSAILQRKSDIADYLNWYEATQMGARTGPFEGYLRAAKILRETQPLTRTNAAISAYLDVLQKEL